MNIRLFFLKVYFFGGTRLFIHQRQFTMVIKLFFFLVKVKMEVSPFGQKKLLKPWSSSSQFLAAPQGSKRFGWGVLNPSIVNFWFVSRRGRSRQEVFFLSFFLKVPTPEGKQHTGGRRGQSCVWTQPLPTDWSCQSLDLACLEYWEELSHHGTGADTRSSAQGRGLSWRGTAF